MHYSVVYTPNFCFGCVRIYFLHSPIARYRFSTMSHLLIPDGPRCVTSHPNTYHTLNISPLQGAATEKPLLSGSRKLLMCAVGLALGVCAFAWGVWLSPKVHEMLVLRTANVARARPFVSQRNALETEAVSKYAVETRLMHSMPQHIYTTPKLEWFRVDHIQRCTVSPLLTCASHLRSPLHREWESCLHYPLTK